MMKLIEYFTCNSLKHIIQKPIGFSYEVFCLNTVSMYLVAFELYQNKKKGPYNKDLVTRFEKSSATVLALLDKLTEDKRGLPYHITFDNSFMSLELMVTMLQE